MKFIFPFILARVLNQLYLRQSYVSFFLAQFVAERNVSVILSRSYELFYVA